MRLIADGVVDREGVPGLATRLGYSSRQLGRILTEELGAGPLALARAQRAQTARQLLVSTAMPVVDVAHASGFASLRQFNDTCRDVYGMTPTEVRGHARAAERGPAGVEAGTVTLRLRVREPFDGAGVLAWLARRAIAGVEIASDGAYTRSLRLARGPAVMTLEPARSEVTVTARLTDLADLPELLARARRLLDLDADPVAIDAALAADPRLAPSVARTPGIRVPGAVDGAEMVVRAILGQQVTVAAARTAVARLVDALGEPLPPALAVDGVTSVFPEPGKIAESGDAHLGGPRARRSALLGACAALAEGTVALHPGVSTTEGMAALEGLAGIGPWTAGYVALRTLGASDILLTGDVAVRAGARTLGFDAPRELVAETASLAPWRSYLMMHLWRAASLEKGQTDARS